MIRFLHTSDWHLGRRLRFLDGAEAVARAHQARYETVKRLGSLAQQREVDFVVVAGDIFDDNTVGRGELALARDALAAFGSVPVLLLPGNHDPATADSALRRLAQRLDEGAAADQVAPTVRVLETTDPVEVSGRKGSTAVVYPCPWTRRAVATDLTRALPPREPGDASVRVALAHGGLLDFSSVGDAPATVDADAVLAKGFDYLALGDWHGWQSHRDRAAYSGTPEPTKFAEKAPGHALVVEIDGPGALPRLDAVEVATLRWLQEERTLTGAEDVQALNSFLDGLPQRSTTALRLTLRGALDLTQRSRLDELLARETDELLYLRPSDLIHLAATADDLQELEGLEGFLGATARELATLADLSAGAGEPGEGPAEITAAQDLARNPGNDSTTASAADQVVDQDIDLSSLPEAGPSIPPEQVAEHALRLLHRLVQQAASDGGGAR